MMKILTSLLVIAVAVGVVAGASGAFFFDTEQSTGNVLQAGTIDIEINGQNPWSESFTLEDMKPCDWAYYEFVIHNVGTNPGPVYMHLNVGEGYDVVCTEPEAAVGGCEINNIEDWITIDLTIEGYVVIPPEFDGGHLKLSDLNCTYLGVGWLEGYCDTITVNLSFHLQAETGNEYQGDAVKFDIEFLMTDRNAPPPKPWLADIGMTKELGDDDAALLGARIIKIYDPSEPELPVAVPGGIAGYVAEANYTGTQINILAVRGGDMPFDAAPVANIDNTAGLTSFSAVPTTGPQPPITVARMVVRLVGSAEEEAQLELSFTEITDGGGRLIPQDESAYEVFRRGDAKADGVVNFLDFVFVAEYLVGSRELGQGADLVHPINAASPKHDDPGDKIDFLDFVYISEYLVGLRDAYFELK